MKLLVTGSSGLIGSEVVSYFAGLGHTVHGIDNNHLSTNKVYGDGPNRIALREEETRWDYADPAFAEGIAEKGKQVRDNIHSLDVVRFAERFLEQPRGTSP